MNTERQPPEPDHYLIARAQALATAADAHCIHALLGNYYELCNLVKKDDTLQPRLESCERKLRSFCFNGRSERMPPPPRAAPSA